jgi:YfiH family protein
MKISNRNNEMFKYNSFSLLRNENLAHGFFTRGGGVSNTEDFFSLNCNPRSSDDKENVLKNQKLVCKSLGFKSDNLKLINQVHSSKVVTILDTHQELNEMQADALVTTVPDLLLGINTADCVPILFFEPHNRIIAAAHAGWKGALNGIIENTLHAMEDLGGMLPSIIASIGPCIQQYSYEVDQTFYDQFLSKNNNNSMFFINSKNKDHYMFDLPGYCIHKLRQIGLLKIENLGIDTYSNPNVLFSFRRSTHENTSSAKPKFGTQLSVIGLTSK